MPAPRGRFPGQSRRLSPVELAERLGRDGYIVAEGLIDPAELHGVRSDVLRVLAEHGRLAAGTAPDDGRPGPAPDGPADPAMADVTAPPPPGGQGWVESLTIPASRFAGTAATDSPTESELNDR